MFPVLTAFAALYVLLEKFANIVVLLFYFWVGGGEGGADEFIGIFHFVIYC